MAYVLVNGEMMAIADAEKRIKDGDLKREDVYPAPKPVDHSESNAVAKAANEGKPEVGKLLKRVTHGGTKTEAERIGKPGDNAGNADMPEAQEADKPVRV